MKCMHSDRGIGEELNLLSESKGNNGLWCFFCWNREDEGAISVLQGMRESKHE